jgi:1,4-dihydroxy-6-naphthoate synthase
MKLSLGFSPCPNDCFVFDAIVNHRIDLEGLEFLVQMSDVEALNEAAFNERADVTKLSYHAYAYAVDAYVLLDAGSALGRGCGPLLISKRPISTEEVAHGALRIAIPGKHTTANFLLALAFPRAQNKTELVFSAIEGALVNGQFDAGLIIHESRFTYEAKGLRSIIDLGTYWEHETGLPIPLAGIAIRRSIADDVKRAVNRLVRRSVEYAFANPDASQSFVRQNAQEMSEDVLRRHIQLYVNKFSVDLGAEGKRAVRELFARARTVGTVPTPQRSLFLDSH